MTKRTMRKSAMERRRKANRKKATANRKAKTMTKIAKNKMKCEACGKVILKSGAKHVQGVEGKQKRIVFVCKDCQPGFPSVHEQARSGKRPMVVLRPTAEMEALLSARKKKRAEVDKIEKQVRELEDKADKLEGEIQTMDEQFDAGEEELIVRLLPGTTYRKIERDHRSSRHYYKPAHGSLKTQRIDKDGPKDFSWCNQFTKGGGRCWESHKTLRKAIERIDEVLNVMLKNNREQARENYNRKRAAELEKLFG